MVKCFILKCLHLSSVCRFRWNFFIKQSSCFVKGQGSKRWGIHMTERADELEIKTTRRDYLERNKCLQKILFLVTQSYT